MRNFFIFFFKKKNFGKEETEETETEETETEETETELLQNLKTISWIMFILEK